MTAPARPDAATSLDRATAAWHRAEDIRQEWLTIATATKPADRDTTETLIAGLYARHGRLRPRFHWVDSPHAALDHIADQPTHADLHRWVTFPPYPAFCPIASDIAAGLSRLRSALDEGIERPTFDGPARKPDRKRTDAQRRADDEERQRPLPPIQALAAGRTFREIVQVGVRRALETSLLRGLVWPVRAALQSDQISWYGQQDAHWIAYYDTWRRLGLADHRHADSTRFDEWANLARSAGWWWLGDDVCVLAERPVALDVVPVRGAWHGEVRLRRIVYRDGWTVDG